MPYFCFLCIFYQLYKKLQYVSRFIYLNTNLWWKRNIYFNTTLKKNNQLPIQMFQQQKKYEKIVKED